MFSYTAQPWTQVLENIPPPLVSVVISILLSNQINCHFKLFHQNIYVHDFRCKGLHSLLSRKSPGICCENSIVVGFTQ